jgi:transposase-like protein
LSEGSEQQLDCKYGISYRDLAETMSERGVAVDPSTIFDL